ncbi:hypothetical protein [Brevibacillus sp. NRS-1366]|uniref:hypothetical protein n=1 Tax=Brevibacillus sp. NRS-1366 TaxID=3233899 RepID=UPI003D25FDBD
MHQLASDVEYDFKVTLRELSDEIRQTQDKLSEEVSGLLFDTINGIPNENDKDIPTQQRISYLTGKIDTLKNLSETMEDLKKNIHLRITKYDPNKI